MQVGQKAYSFLEILVSLACISIFCVAVGSRLANVGQDAAVTIALQEMVQIKEAVRDYFYSDLGVIPQDPGEDGAYVSDNCASCGEDDRPWYASRFLCLRNDGEGNPQYEEMLAFLSSLMTEVQAEGKMVWDRYYQKGWRGPYMEYETREQITTDAEEAFPLIATPWAEVSEELAQEAEEAGNTQDAERLRRGKYYFIVVDRDPDQDYALIKESARIVCFGPDGADSGSYYTDFDADDPTTLTTVEELRQPPTCDDDQTSGDECYETGDDLVMFIFGGGATRYPADTE